ncbi:MAG: superoxide dismutase family protein [Nitrospirae bacterium]|nr:superoxide dismutase family protein [Nitrospirota bacterium]
MRTAPRDVWTWFACAVMAGACVKQPARTARAILQDTTGRPVGEATFRDTSEGVEVKLRLEGLPAGPHALHIHGEGACQPPGFESSGAHFNPDHKQHGLKNPAGAHLGDLPNVSIVPEGPTETRLVIPQATLEPGDRSLLKAGGTALILHAGADDEMSDPAGRAGPRIACGVIQP